MKFDGELLPGFNKGILKGRSYPKGLLNLDSKYDESAILLGFKISTRFDQLRQNHKDENPVYIRTTRKELIKWANLIITDQANKTVATRRLEKTLNKLIRIKCIGRYTPKRLSNKDNEYVYIYPPVQKQLNKLN